MIMKNLYINMAFIFVLLLITASCSDKDDSAPRVIPTMNLTVSEIADNTALNKFFSSCINKYFNFAVRRDGVPHPTHNKCRDSPAPYSDLNK